MTTAEAGALEERTVPGLHSFVLRTAVPCARGGDRALDLGAGSGAFGMRLQERGFDVLCCDREPGVPSALRFLGLDLNDSDFAGALGAQDFELVTAIEVIEHLEAPVSFLRNVARLLAPAGVAIVTTPNVDSLAARMKFLFRGRLRMLDAGDDPTHISPIFWDLLCRQYLPGADLALIEARQYPPQGFVVGRSTYRRALRLMKPLLRGRLGGDNHVLTLAHSAFTEPTKKAPHSTDSSPSCTST